MTEKIIPVPKTIKKDLTGQTFGTLTVIGYAGQSRTGINMWLCRCTCGRTRQVFGTNLTLGKSKGCGHRASHGTHGMAHTPEYKSWYGMIQRCENPAKDNYSNYGGRGIKVCARWRASFIAFLEDMGNRPGPGYSMDRINQNGNYEPSNCRWATATQQQNNRRVNHHLTYNGATHTIAEWAKITGLSPAVLKKRIKSGWSVSRILTEPIDSRKSSRDRH